MTVLDAVVRVAREADDGPMRAREILPLAEQIVGKPVSWSWVKGCLALNSTGRDAQFARVARGMYRLAR